ncbi:hypothetical protein FNH08_41675, partial [Streptomyces spongiae]|nr:hypothetical protein [Streptomyces spongiae]
MQQSSGGGVEGVRGRTGTCDAKQEHGSTMSDEPQPKQDRQGWAPREPEPGPARRRPPQGEPATPSDNGPGKDPDRPAPDDPATASS